MALMHQYEEQRMINYCDQKQHRPHEDNKKKEMGEKQLYCYFKWQIAELSHENTMTSLRKGNMKMKLNLCW